MAIKKIKKITVQTMNKSKKELHKFAGGGGIEAKHFEVIPVKEDV